MGPKTSLLGTQTLWGGVQDLPLVARGAFRLRRTVKTRVNYSLQSTLSEQIIIIKIPMVFVRAGCFIVSGLHQHSMMHTAARLMMRMQEEQAGYCPGYFSPTHPTIEALIIRIGFWGPLYYNYNKEPQNPILIIKAPTLLQSFRQLEPRYMDLWFHGPGP